VSAFHWPWPVLGIAPTDDRKTIREAYARLLKALDPDAATEAFMELRDARDAALSGQFLHPPRAEGEEYEDDFGLGTPLPEGTATPETPPPADHPPEPEERPVFTVAYSDDDDRRFQRVVDLLLGEAPLTAADNDEINRHLDTLFADDRMADLGHYARIETWLAQLLAERFPRGAAFFPRIAEHFEWGTRAHELGIHPAIPWLFNSHEGHGLVSELETPGHAYHREWIELARGKPKGPLWTRAIDKPRMANLIGTIRRDYPWLEQEHWQPELVERWEKKTQDGATKGPGPWTWLMLGIFLFTLLARIAGSDFPDSAPTVALDQSTEEVLDKYRYIESPDLAISAFIESRFPDSDVDVPSLRAGNPEFFQEMVQVWDIYKMEPESFDSELIEMITEEYFLHLGGLPYPLLVDELKQREAVLLGLQDDPKRCVDFLRNPQSFAARNVETGDIPPRYVGHMLEVIQNKLPELGTGAPLSREPVTEAGLSALSAKSGLAASALAAGLTKPDASDAVRCATRLALYRRLPDLPETEARKLMTLALKLT